MKFVSKVVTKKMDYPYSLGRLLENLSKQSIKTMDAKRSGNLRTKFWCLQIRAEICQKFGWLFGRFEDTKISF